jgi:hypothetical protein
MWCGVVWCGVVWCGVVWCGVVWCGVVWCGVWHYPYDVTGVLCVSGCLLCHTTRAEAVAATWLAPPSSAVLGVTAGHFTAALC